MDYYSLRKPMRSDCLWVLRVIICDIFQFKIVFVTLVNLVALNVAAQLVQLYYFLTEPHLFARYGPLYTALFFTLASGVVLVWKRRTMDTSFDRLDRWDISSAGPEQEKKIREETKRILVFVALNTAIGFISGVLIAVPEIDDEGMYIGIYLTLRWFNFLREYSLLVQLLYKLQMVVLGYSMLVLPYFLMYAVHHSKFQMNMCMVYVSRINFGLEDISEDVLANSPQYQRIIKKRMKFCIKRYLEILKWGQAMKRELVIPIFAVLGFCAFLLGFSIIFGFIQRNCYTSSKLKTSWQVLIGTVIAATFWSVIYCGQLVQDEMDKIEHHLTALPWHTWNRENRTLFTIAQGCFLVPFKLDFSSKFAINNDMGVQMLKAIYSLASVVMSMKSH